MEAVWLSVMGLSMLLLPTLPSLGGGLKMQTRGGINDRRCMPQTPGLDCYCLIQSANTSTARL